MDKRYRIENKASDQGGFGRVDKAWDQHLERSVAIKTLDPLFKPSPSSDDKERFKREAKALASLTHPNIPAIYDILMSDERDEFKIIFQWIDGISLREYLTNKGTLTLDVVKRWFGNICSALTHAHTKGIIHRDIKPSNLIVTHDLESCYLVDFGIALKSTDLKKITSGTPPGTPGYMSPEHERGEELDSSSDIFLLGIVLYECLAGSKPSVGMYTPLNSINETIPSTIDNLVRCCLHERSSRLQSATEFIDQLRSSLKPKATFSKILAQGSLADINLSLQQMSAEDYSNLPVGQQILITSRLMDMIQVGESHMKNPVASLLSVLISIAHLSAEDGYDFIVQKAILYGYEVKYGEVWTGNIAIRNSLNNIALHCHTKAHNTIAKNVLKFWHDINSIYQKDSWYSHDLRILLQNLLANDQCHVDVAKSLAERLNQLNKLTHNVTEALN